MNTPINNLKYHHRFSDYLYWNLVAAVPVMTASIAIYKNSLIWLIVYLGLLMAFVTIIMKFYCSHCPHYVRGRRVITCMFFWGVPKIFRQRQGPLNVIEKGITFISAIIILLLPGYWLIKLPEFLLIYVFSVTVLAMTIKRYECSRCIYEGCPSNSVGKPG